MAELVKPVIVGKTDSKTESKTTSDDDKNKLISSVYSVILESITDKATASAKRINATFNDGFKFNLPVSDSDSVSINDISKKNAFSVGIEIDSKTYKQDLKKSYGLDFDAVSKKADAVGLDVGILTRQRLNSVLRRLAKNGL